MNSKSRIERLEKASGANKQETPCLVVVCDDTGKPSEAVLEKAKAEYKAKHPDWEEECFNIVWVRDEYAKKNVERVMAGERT